MGCVYLATNTVNGKAYVGKTTGTMRDRRRGHEYSAEHGSTLPFHRALRKYSADAFKWEMLFRGTDENALFAAEKKFIVMLGTKCPGGYNLTDGGEGLSGHHHSTETKAKI
jgi:hypothetical protein